MAGDGGDGRGADSMVGREAEATITERLAQNQQKDLLRLLTAGSVDDGKSTLIGRLLFDSKLIYEDHLRSLERDSRRVGSAGDSIDYALLVDGLRAEREQGITIDVAYRYFSTPRRKFIIADCPGHVQYTRNMATGASTADLAIILIDAQAGVLEQTRRHSFIASLLGIQHLVVAINKMDLVDYSRQVFEDIRRDYLEFAARLGTRTLHFVPISALRGDNVVSRGDRTPWFQGLPILALLEEVHIAADRNLIDMRFPIQHVMRQDASFRGYAGTVASGILRRGHEVMVLPSGQAARVDRIVTYDGDRDEAFPPMAVTVTLDREVDVSRGDVLVYPGNLPRLESEFEANVVWMSEEPLRRERPYAIKHATSSVSAEIARIAYRFDVTTLHRVPAETLALNEIGRVRVSAARPLAFDPYARNRATGAFILIDRVTHGTVGAGMILDRRTADDLDDDAAVDAIDGGRSRNVHAHASAVTADERAARLGQPAAVVWLTGLPRSGKSTVAYAAERRLFDAGYAVHVLDGENLRLGINRNLGFGALERSESVRRAAQVAGVCADAGLITLVALVSPYEADRHEARRIAGAERFFEVHLSAPADTCEARDDAGLYARARRGEIPQFTGVSAPYEAPAAPDLTLPTHEISVDEAVERLVAFVLERAPRTG